jgi:hypothetical protein
MINEWRNYRKEATDKIPTVKMQLTRQLLSAKEMGMIKKGMTNKQDYFIIAARGMMRIGVIDDMIRRSFKAYRENELKINVSVLITSIRHSDDKGVARDESIMIGLASEGGDERMGMKIQAIEKGKKKAMMLLEGIDIQLFREGQAIWNTSKPSVLGCAEKYIELVCPGECDGKEVMETLAEMGIKKICMMAKSTKKRGKLDEIWTIVPAKGEGLEKKQITKEERRWDAHEYGRIKESDKLEVGHVSWAMGVLKSSNPHPEKIDIGSISSLTSVGTGATTTSIARTGNTISLAEVLEGAKNHQNQIIMVEREKTRQEMNTLKLDLIDVLKQDKEERVREKEKKDKED